ncbi:MAG: ornithine cyclodeaminase [Alphaproteobacteria bacterium]|nr:ornithine cyclodeaminase [Alphaproteobacteria bacterium]
MRWIDAEAVRDATTPFDALFDWLEAAHRKPPALTRRALIEVEAPDGTANAFLTLPAWAPGEGLGVKMATVFPQNEKNGADLPAIQGVYQLFDGSTGAPAAVIDGTMLTLRKTAADSGLGARLLAPPEPEVMLMVGAGGLCPPLIEAHRAARPSLNRILIWNRTAARAEARAEALRAAGIDARAVAEIEPAARDADVISCATMATEPLIRGAWLKPGCHLDLVGGYTPAMREADDDACTRARLFVDSRPFTIGHAGDLVQPMAAGAIGEDDVLADLFQLCQGAHPGRGGDTQAVTLFKNGGGGHLDLMVAQFIARAAT